MQKNSTAGRRRGGRVLLALGLVCGVVVAATPGSSSAGEASVMFDKEFVPDTIGPDSTSTLTFTIDNSFGGATPLVELAFTDTLPPDVFVAAAPAIVNGCAGTLIAAPGSGSIVLDDGLLAAGEDCEISVNVTSSEVTSEGGHENTTGTLTSAEGSHGTAFDELFVDDDLPGFTKSFAPSVIEFGERSTLTFTIDNSSSGSDQITLDFTDTLPTGLTIADPALASTDCGTTVLPPTLIAVPGTSVITLDADGVALFPALGGEDTCTVEVDVIGGAVGVLQNVSGDLIVDLPKFTSAGKATDPIEVTEIEETLELLKSFGGAAPPGGTTTLEFTVTNKSRDFAATDIEFSDDLDDALTGLEAIGALANTCGGMASSTFPTGLFEYEGGTLPPEGTCSVVIEVLVPTDAAAGSYPNVAGPVTGVIDGSPVEGNEAGDLLFVIPFPVLEKDFTVDTIGSGDTVTLEFTITNPEDGSTMSDITFFDELTEGSGDGEATTGFLPFPVTITSPALPAAACGGTLTLVAFDTDRQRLEFTGGSLEAAGHAGGGDSCTFSVDIEIPSDLGAATYTNTTDEISATLDDLAGTPTVTGPGGSDDLTVVAAPRLSKEFTDDPALPGGTVELKLTLTNPDTDNAATAIAFSDDLTTVVGGLEAASVDSNTCTGAIVDISTPTTIDVTSGSLDPEATCEITLTLDVPSDVGGIFLNVTSEVTATVAGLAAKSAGGSDELVVTGLLVTKAFDPDTVIPGDETVLTFTLDNIGAADASAILFTDDLKSILSGTPDITVVPPLPVAPCGGTLTELVGVLAFTGGSVDSGDPPCSFDVTVSVPTGAADGQYVNVTSDVDYSAPAAVSGPPARAELFINKTLLELTKEFTDDPVEPGDPVTLKFTLENLSDTDTVDLIEFDDDLDAALTGLEAVGATSNTCGGMATSTFPTGLFEYEGGTLAPEATCEIVLTVDVPDPPLPGRIFTNTTSEVKGDVSGLEVTGEPASDDLLIRSAEFTKSFDGPAAAAGTAELTFTITNVDSSAGQVGLAFSDDLDAALSGLVAVAPLPADPCGAGSALSGTGFLSLTGGGLPPSGECEFTVSVAVPPTAASGDYLNVTSTLFASGIPVDEPTTAVLTVENPPFTPIDGKRYADTRSPGGTTFDGLFAGDGRFGPGAEYEVDIAGRGDVPLGAVGAIINVTVVGSSAAGFATVHPCEPTPPNASTINYTTSVDVANEIFAPLSPGGSVCTFTSAEIDLLLDVVGYVLDDDSVKLMTPVRLAESRVGPPTIDGLFEGFGPTAAGSTTKITVLGRGGIPASGVSAVIANVTAVDPTDDNFLTVFPCLPDLPLASSLNYTSGVNRANELVAQVDPVGDICVYTNSSIHFIVDVSGYVLAGSDLVSVDPARFVDTRPGGVTVDGANAGTGALAAGSATEVKIADRGGIPADAVAAIVNVAAVDPTTAGFFTVDSCGAPTESSLNYTTGVNGANELVVKLDAVGELCIYTSAVADVIMDVVGYQMPTPL